MFENIAIVDLLVAILCGWVWGSIPSGLWIVRTIHGIDIREYGSKNIGATNVFRTVGVKTAVLVLLADALKGVLALVIVNYLYHNSVVNSLAAAGALLGHSHSLFLKFKGGKGVATGLGLLIYLMPLVSAASFAVWLLCVLTTRYVSLGSILASVCTPFFAFYFGYPVPYIVFGAIAGLFVIVRHRENIKRLLNGSESKIKPGNAETLKK